MKKLGKLFAVMLVLGIAFASCSKDNEYYEEPVNPIAPGVENPIVPPPSVSPAN